MEKNDCISDSWKIPENEWYLVVFVEYNGIVQTVYKIL